MILLIDNREQACYPYLDYLTVDYNVCRLTVGDYCVYDDDRILFIIERKTIADMLASFTDGRKENVEKLLSLREKTGCKIFYFLETGYKKVPPNITAHFDHLIFRDNIHIVHTKNVKDTISRINTFCKHYLPDAKLPVEEKKESKLDLSQILTDMKGCQKLSTLEDKQIKLWKCFPKVSTQGAIGLARSQNTLKDFINGVGLKHPIQYRSGRPMSKIIVKFLDTFSGQLSKGVHNKHLLKAFTEIRGLSMNSVKYMMETHTLIEIINMTEDVLSKVQKTSKRKICKKLAQEVLLLLQD